MMVENSSIAAPKSSRCARVKAHNITPRTKNKGKICSMRCHMSGARQATIDVVCEGMSL
jgi:hypothetical protein